LTDLTTLDEFDAAAAASYQRENLAGLWVTMLVTGALFATFGAEWSAHGEAFAWSLVVPFVIGLWVGIPFAFLGRLFDRRDRQRRVRDQLVRIFEEDPHLVPPSPPDATSRLVCGVMLSRTRAYGGILYVDSTGLTFQFNHARKRFWHWGPPLAPPPIRIGPPRTIVLRVARLRPAPLWLRPIAGPALTVLVCRWGTGDTALALRVPVPETVMRRLQGCVDALRAVAETQPAR
jgi:hypothetical protein